MPTKIDGMKIRRVAAAGLQAGRAAYEELSLCLNTAGRRRIADRAEGAGFARAPVRPSASEAAIGSARGPDQSQEALLALQGGALAANGHSAPGRRWRSGRTKPALVARFRYGHAGQRPAPPRSPEQRGLISRVDRSGARYLQARLLLEWAFIQADGAAVPT